MTTPLPTRYTIQHDSYFEYDKPVSNKIMLVRLQPRNDQGQHLRSFSLTTKPIANPVACVDSFGNMCHTISIFKEAKKTHVRSTSQVNTPEALDLDKLPHGSWDELRNQAKRAKLWHYLAPSKLVYPGDPLDNFIKKHGLKMGSDPLSTLRTLCSELYLHLDYEPGSTTVESPLEDFLETGKGVCQDYTHAMLALGRNWGIPCRYVSGYLYIPSSTQSHSREVASHAWPEFWLPGSGWIGLDPTNNSVADHRFVRVAQGRDYSDVAPTRGVIFGGVNMSISVKVIMTPAEPDPRLEVGMGINQDLLPMAAPPWKSSIPKSLQSDKSDTDQ